jgi:transposase
MAKKARKYSAEFKQDAVRRMAGAASIVGLARQLGVRRKLLYQWRDRFQAEGKAGFERRVGRPPGGESKTPSPPPASAAEVRIAELERLLGRKQLEVDFLKRAFEQVRGAASSRTSDGGKESIAQSKRGSRSKE